MCDDFERAVLLSFDAQRGAADVALRGRAEAYLATLRASPGVWRPCAERFGSTAHAEVQFWCLQTLHAVRARGARVRDVACARVRARCACATFCERASGVCGRERGVR
jgi:hypothetical protein